MWEVEQLISKDVGSGSATREDTRVMLAVKLMLLNLFSLNR